MVLKESDNGGTVNASPQETIAIHLPENPTTGYQWKPDAAADPVVRLKAATYLPGSGSVGEGGTRVFEFEAKAPGETIVRLKLLREWEGETAAIDRFEARVVVT